MSQWIQGCLLPSFQGFVVGNVIVRVLPRDAVLVAASQEIKQRGLAAAGRAHDGQRLARHHRPRHAMENLLLHLRLPLELERPLGAPAGFSLDLHSIPQIHKLAQTNQQNQSISPRSKSSKSQNLHVCTT